MRKLLIDPDYVQNIQPYRVHRQHKK